MTKVVVRAGECVSAGSFGDGTVIEVTETLPNGVEVTSKTVSPADQGRPCAVARADRLCALVRAGFLAKLTFTNSTTTEKGSLEICKVAGTGIAPGTPFTFAVRDTAGGGRDDRDRPRRPVRGGRPVRGRRDGRGDGGRP